MIKRIICRPTKVLFLFKKEESFLYGPRVKSAPPIEINFSTLPKPEPRPVVRFTKADGTPITEDDLLDLTTDSESSTDSDCAVNNNKQSLSVEGSEVKEELVYVEVIENNTCVDIIESRIENDIQQEMKVPDEDGRAMMLENFLKKFSGMEITVQKPRLSYDIFEILSVEERKVIPLNLKLRVKGDVRYVYKVEKNKKETSIELARLEFNRLTAKNLGFVINNLKEIKVETINEMKEISTILFDKAVSEPTFVKYYAVLVLDMKKDWQSEEEKSKNASQTVFFGTLLTLMLKTLENREKWGDGKYNSNQGMTFEERKGYEEKLEEAETERYVKKRKTLGTINFLSSLYSLNAISYSHVNACIEALMKSKDAENVEVLCHFIDSIGEKLVVSGKEHIISQVCTNLAHDKDNYENRIKYMIESLLEKRVQWKPKEKNTRNLFSCLEVENEEQKLDQVASVCTIAEVYPLLSMMSEELSMAYEEDDKKIVSDNFKTGEQRFGVYIFYKAYLQEAICNHKASEAFFDLFISFRAATSITEDELVNVLRDIKNDLGEISIDFPISLKKYAELITRLMIESMLPNHLFEQLKTDDYESKVVELLSKWYKSENDRKKALAVFPSEKIEGMIKK
ncbi:Eukaryotic translation initiation factor 4 gamma [Ordospora colligata]|uniref:MIF4G domain-containing protein n=1 Tax=Ordospora colligata OC4 TaxID=1354746 RepID=A0A0B2ULR9_9MICR|nr:uncharacterized protein M896_042120 [Ordospora colligata OC4]KHN70012.1 hypothetical protein M896_042120 [Ordospora colligata OC4]TBU16182.1 hypothetical protein CWI41_042110 [Ordospora colligata]TBU16395.1 hypothetical protein CWI40_042110 [Ordospora colligata]